MVHVIDSANETTYWKPHRIAPRFDTLADEDNFYFVFCSSLKRGRRIRETYPSVIKINGILF